MVASHHPLHGEDGPPDGRHLPDLSGRVVRILPALENAKEVKCSEFGKALSEKLSWQAAIYPLPRSP
jgi:hypothetical protein